MAKRPEPKRKSAEDFLADLRKGHGECFGHLEGRRYLEKVLSAQHSLPNAVKFFAYDLLAEDAYHEGATAKCLEAVAGAREYLEAAQEEWPRETKEYMPSVRFCERGSSVLADEGDVEGAIALCDLAIQLGLGKAYEAKRQSLERRL
ncbi:MAG: hypothetical protein JWM80_5442 [Cyanobacteria bacterium RYN_339]|nr:hypothetical protein [Cyanobacteria bacterium RYN_339]